MRKKLTCVFAVILALILALNIVITAFAADSDALTAQIEAVTAEPGDSVELTLEIANNPGLTSLKFELYYDEALLELTGVEFNSGFGSLVSAVEPFKSPQTLSFISPFAAVDVNGDFAVLTFKIADDAANGAVANIELRVNPDDIIDGNDEVVPITVKNGSVLVSFGDVITPVDDFNYEIQDGEIVITGYTGDEAKVVIAEEYTVDGATYPVTGIAESAFETNTVITSVEIPASVKAIGDYAFYDCTSLKEATVNGKDTTIGEKALGYYYISRKQDGVNEGFTVNGYAGSTAESYAAADGDMTFAAIEEECEHKNAQPGEGKEPTCLVPGLTAGVFCPDCNTWLVPQTQIAPSHKFGEWAVNGSSRSRECTVCYEKETEAIINNIMSLKNTVIEYDREIIFSDVFGLNAVSSIIYVPGTVSAQTEQSVAGLFGTGSLVTVFSGTKLVGEYTLIIKGDLNGDSVCDVLDAMLTEQISNGHQFARQNQIFAANGCISGEIDAASYQNVVNISLTA